MSSSKTHRQAEKLAGLLWEIQDPDETPVESLRRFQDAYEAASPEERTSFFATALRQLEIRKKDIAADTNAVLHATPEDAVLWTSLLTTLRKKLESPRMRAFRRFLNTPGGLKFLLDLRADVLQAQRQGGPELGPLDEEIAHLFTSWFQHGFLFLQEITEESPYGQIRFLKNHDMVHPMASLEEMGSRLGADRRAFALYHRAMPEEPVVFIEVALTRKLPRSIHEILGDSPRMKGEPDTAIFYSINNAQNGLAGLGLGKVLIYQVVDSLKRDHPQIKTFATLSPVPGFFRRYVKPLLETDESPFAMSRKRFLASFNEKSRRRLLEHGRGQGGDFAAFLLEVLSTPDWIEDPLYEKEFTRPLRELTFFYLTEEKDARGRPLNPVANFHMGNGARLILRNVHFGANRTPRGLGRSCGMMVSYVYSSTWLHELRRTARSALS